MPGSRFDSEIYASTKDQQQQLSGSKLDSDTSAIAEKNKMRHLLDRISKELRDYLRRHFPRYIIRVYKRKGNFYVLVIIPRGKISNNDRNFLFRNIRLISHYIYRKYSMNFYEFKCNYVPCFQLLSSSGNNHGRHNFLVVRKH